MSGHTPRAQWSVVVGMSPTVARGVSDALDLIRREDALRSDARLLELIPARASDARRLFHQADQLHAERLEVLTQCGLL